MDFLNGITLLLLYELGGEALVQFFDLPIPGPVIGMMALFLTLLIRSSSTPAFGSASTNLLNHLPLLFVPAGVGMMLHFDFLVEEWLPLLMSLLLSTALTMAVTAAIASGMTRLMPNLASEGE